MEDLQTRLLAGRLGASMQGQSLRCDLRIAAFLPYPPPPRDPIRSAELIEPLDSGEIRSFALEKLEDSTDGSLQFLIGIERNLVAIIHVPGQGQHGRREIVERPLSEPDSCTEPRDVQRMARRFRRGA